MEQAQDPTARAPAQGASPVKAFVALLVALAAALLAWQLTRPDDAAPAADGARGPEQAAPLTEAEAIQEFERLHGLYVRSYAERDLSLISLYAAPGSDLADSSDIRSLLREGVLDETRWEQRSVQILYVGRDEFVLSQVVEVHPRFVDESTGEDLTFGEPRLETVSWTVHLYPQGWRLVSAKVKKAHRLEGSR